MSFSIFFKSSKLDSTPSCACLYVLVFLNPLKMVILEFKSKDALKLSVDILALLILSIKEPNPNLPDELPFKFGKKLPFAMATFFSASFTLSLFCWIEIFLTNA